MVVFLLQPTTSIHIHNLSLYPVPAGRIVRRLVRLGSSNSHEAEQTTVPFTFSFFLSTAYYISVELLVWLPHLINRWFLLPFHSPSFLPDGFENYVATSFSPINISNGNKMKALRKSCTSQSPIS